VFVFGRDEYQDLGVRAFQLPVGLPVRIGAHRRPDCRAAGRGLDRQRQVNEWCRFLRIAEDLTAALKLLRFSNQLQTMLGVRPARAELPGFANQQGITSSCPFNSGPLSAQCWPPSLPVWLRFRWLMHL
jgi:hypothetical protein